MEQNFNQKRGEILKAISTGRERTSLLWKYEKNWIAFLVKRIPSWMSSDMLTLIGFCGSLLVFLSFILAAYLNVYYLLLNVLGFFIIWFGDSLDGRLAYYRNKPRKWYGFSLDIIVDWLSIILMGWGYIIYATGLWEILGFIFVVFYAWEMLIALIRYKINDKYSIDAGIIGPTEVRIIISFILAGEVFVKNSIYFTLLAVTILVLVVNIIESRKLLILADERDKSEHKKENA
jgi:hypothetical protein